MPLYDLYRDDQANARKAEFVRVVAMLHAGYVFCYLHFPFSFLFYEILFSFFPFLFSDYFCFFISWSLHHPFPILYFKGYRGGFTNGAAGHQPSSFASRYPNQTSRRPAAAAPRTSRGQSRSYRSAAASRHARALAVGRTRPRATAYRPPRHAARCASAPRCHRPPPRRESSGHPRGHAPTRRVTATAPSPRAWSTASGRRTPAAHCRCRTPRRGRAGQPSSARQHEQASSRA
jgi:hypothetical protein